MHDIICQPKSEPDIHGAHGKGGRLRGQTDLGREALTGPIGPSPEKDIQQGLLADRRLTFIPVEPSHRIDNLGDQLTRSV